MLTDSGVILTRFIFPPGASCDHRAGEGQIVLRHLRAAPEIARKTFAIRLARLSARGIRLWSDRPDCALCAYVRALGEAGDPTAPTPDASDPL